MKFTKFNILFFCLLLDICTAYPMQQAQSMYSYVKASNAFSKQQTCSTSTGQQTIAIINNTSGSVQVTHPIPEYSKATISFTKIGKIDHDDEYVIIALPENFLSCDNGHSLNNLGQVAGFIRDNKVQSLKINPRQRWGSPLQMPSEKAHGCQAAIWSLSNGLIKSALKNSRAVALNDYGFVAVSRAGDLPNPDVLWDVNTNDFEAGPKWTDKENIGTRRIKISIFDHMRKILDINENKTSLTIMYDPFNHRYEPELTLVNSGKYSIIPFENDLDVNTTRIENRITYSKCAVE